MKEKVMKIVNKAAELAKKKPVFLIAVGVAVIAAVGLIVLICTRTPEKEQFPESVPSVGMPEGVVGNTSMPIEELDNFDFSLAQTSQEDIDSAVAFVGKKLDEKAAEPYVKSLEKGKIYADDEKTFVFRARFFRSNYTEKNQVTDTYINQNTIAVIAEYKVDYDEEQVPYAEGDVKTVYYLMRVDLTGEWSVFKTETIESGDE